MRWHDLKGVDVVILSDDDIRGNEYFLEEIRRVVDHVVMTQGRRGALVYKENSEHFFPSLPVEMVDSTGAGDVFTTAYLIAYHQTQDIKYSCAYAHCAASYIIQGVGITNLPTEEMIQKRIKEYYKKFF